jgi:pyruvate dehydrogenase E2 component (dihydrolipoamide acetyltransferase)
MHEISVPEIADNVTEGKVVSISVAVGDMVEIDQTLLELETDKAVVAIPSPFDGQIKEIRVSEGDTVKVGAVIMIGELAEDLAPLPVAQNRPEIDGVSLEVDSAPAPDVPPSLPSTAVAPAPDVPPSLPSTAMPSMSPPDPKVDLHTVRTGDRVAPAAPSIRRLARDLGVDIYQVQGTGPGGRIGKEDILSFVRDSMERSTGTSASLVSRTANEHVPANRPLPDFSKWGNVKIEPLSRVRELTADRMAYAWSTIPMVTQYDKADITRLSEFRKEFNDRASAEAKLTMTSILLKVCAAALRVFPQFNSSLDLAGNALIFKEYIHIGVAVNTDRGLLVPVIRDVDHKGIERLAQELNDTAIKTRERRIDPAELEGGTFTISNLGGIGGTAFSPIVYAPQVAILGVSRASREAVWKDDGFKPRLIMPLSLTYDHRVIDGADAAHFLRWICQAVEQPIRLLLYGK